MIDDIIHYLPYRSVNCLIFQFFEVIITRSVPTIINIGICFQFDWRNFRSNCRPTDKLTLFNKYSRYFRKETKWESHLLSWFNYIWFIMTIEFRLWVFYRTMIYFGKIAKHPFVVNGWGAYIFDNDIFDLYVIDLLFKAKL